MITKTKTSSINDQREPGSSSKNKKSNNEEMRLPCDVCKFVARTDSELNRHLENIHRFVRVNRQRNAFTKEERKKNGLCFQWNNGSCRFDEFCKFAHDEIPQCYYDGRCTKTDCRFYHNQQKHETPAPFLYRRGLQNNHFQNQRRNMGERLRR